MHQRSCRVIKGLAEEMFEIESNIRQVAVEAEQNTIINDIVFIKAGVKMPKSFDQWKLANDYFTAALPIA